MKTRNYVKIFFAISIVILSTIQESAAQIDTERFTFRYSYFVPQRNLEVTSTEIFFDGVRVASRGSEPATRGRSINYNFPFSGSRGNRPNTVRIRGTGRYDGNNYSFDETVNVRQNGFQQTILGRKT